MEGEREKSSIAVYRYADLLLAIGIVALVFLLIIPLPPLCLDALLSISFFFSVMALLLSVSIETAFELSAFPSILLFLTLFRLTLNLASTRLILTEVKAGKIIATLGDLVMQGNEVVGLLLFFLLSLINFVVVTKGAGRVAEVAARFTLEALPGKQMAIDSELSTGLISQAQAKEARKKLSSEGDFYGAMDGASKFVKGDAIAALLITVLNLFGGLIIGVTVQKISFGQCWTTISRLTIGEGLVTQIPALLLSLSSAIMVTRSSADRLSQLIPKQLFSQPKVLFVAGGFLLLLSMIPGMPGLLLISFSFCVLAIAHFQTKKGGAIQKKEDVQAQLNSLLVPPLEIHLGYQALVLVEPFQHHLEEIRQKVLSHLGILIPSVHFSDGIDLPPSGWAILAKGVKCRSGRGAQLSTLIDHFTEVVKTHAHEWLNRQDVAVMLQEVKRYNSAVIDELYPKKLSLGQIVKVLQHLLKEGVPIRDLITILEILADHASGEKSNIDHLVEAVREGLARKITEEFIGKTQSAHIITIDPKIEQMLALSKGAIRPKTVDQLTQAILSLDDQAKKGGLKPILVTTSSTRAQLKAIIVKHLPALPVLSYKEITSDIHLIPIGMVSNEVLI